ncbi:e3 ubiquitin ligase ARI9 [Fusarium beomiforme]|uniref:RBR-type E3 ubiquitin transferase n=1 Tax=Fusarium beomiforme TaxID=44412 RepID=A0A9P5DZD0_9HYPO|nr:e3 ubiquitin ligase ARI9 [Fusarium beomiforme]
MLCFGGSKDAKPVPKKKKATGAGTQAKKKPSASSKPTKNKSTRPKSSAAAASSYSFAPDLKSKTVDEVKCPECRVQLGLSDVERLADKATFAKYEAISLRTAMGEVENFVWCAHDCGSGQIHESGSEQPIVVCRKCERRTCSKCDVAWHEDLTCEEYARQQEDPDFQGYVELENEKYLKAKKAKADQRKADRAKEKAAKEKAKPKKAKEAAKSQNTVAERRRIAARKKAEEEKSKAILKRTTKPCKGCGWAIEKNAGCSHMTCRHCGYEFCWSCDKDWTSTHSINCLG